MLLSPSAELFYASAAIGHLPRALAACQAGGSFPSFFEEVAPFAEKLQLQNAPMGARFLERLRRGNLTEGREILQSASPGLLRDVSTSILSDHSSAGPYTSQIRNVIRHAQEKVMEAIAKATREVERILSNKSPAEAIGEILSLYARKQSAMEEAQESEEKERISIELVILKESAIKGLREHLEKIMPVLAEAMKNTDPQDAGAADALSFTAWFGPPILPFIQSAWKENLSDTPNCIALRETLLHVCKKIGLSSVVILKKIRPAEKASFQTKIDGVIEELSRSSAMRPYREIRACHDEESVTLYQAFSRRIAAAAVEEQGLNVPGFDTGRMTWIKPSLGWMLYRAGFGNKAPTQEKILAVRLRRDTFEAILARGVLAQYNPEAEPDEERWRTALQATDVKIQWDPERTTALAPLPFRTIQIGIEGSALRLYLDGILGIEDITPTARIIAGLVAAGRFAEAEEYRSEERPYILPQESGKRIGIKKN